jgi:GTP-binding protein
VPEGTVVYGKESGRLVTELLHTGDRVVLLRGGRGGIGNEHFKSSTNRAPRQTIPGSPGEFGIFRFEMKIIADVGLVGFPNAGKSSLLNALTNTLRRTGSYPFTTIHPKVGVVIDESGKASFTIADIPGIIEGAHANRGLGFRFLKHIERCRILLFIVDMAAIDGRSPIQDLHVLRNELQHYDNDLFCRPSIIAANKMDIPTAQCNFDRFSEAYRKETILKISCASGEGLRTLKTEIQSLILKK